MNKNLTVYLVLLVSLVCSTNIFAISTNNSVLYSSAESIISSEPTQITESVSYIYSKYRNLESRWIGKDNVVFNHSVINNNSMFAQTKIFDENYTPAESQTVQYIRLKYTTSYLNKDREVAGLILLPPQKKVKGIVLFFHSTMTGKLRVPSLKFDEYKTQMLAAIFAANGYVVVAPDYIGLGDDYKISHPYIIYPDANVYDGYNMLLASKAILNKYDIRSDSLPLFVSGYSEGASYALWFSRIYQESSNFHKKLNKAGYHLAMTVPIDGAYDVSGVMFPFLLGNQINESQNIFNINTTFWGTLLKPSLLANTLLGYASHNQLQPQDLFNKKFYLINCINGLPWCSHNNLNYNLDSVRFINTSQFKMALNYYFQAFGISTGGISNAYGLFNNSVKSLINPNLLNFESSLLYKTAKEADVVKWKSTNPVTLVSLASDSLVPEQNSENAYNGMLASGSTNLNYIKVDNNLLKARAVFGENVTDHVSFELYALLIALKQFNSFHAGKK